MQLRLKNSTLALCLFVFLFVVIGGGFHLTPGAAFLAAVSGTPLVIYAFNRMRGDARYERASPAVLRNRRGGNSDNAA